MIGFRRKLTLFALLAGLLAGAVAFGYAAPTIGDFSRALSALPVKSGDRILAAIEEGLTQPGFPAEGILQLIEVLAVTPGSIEEKEGILILVTRTIEEGLPVDGILAKGFDLTAALGEGLPIEGIVLEALKGFAQRAPLPAIEYGISRRLILLRAVRDLLFEKEIFSVPPGAPQTTPTALPAARFNELLLQISDAVSDYLDGGGSPFEGEVLLEQVTDRLTRLPEEVIPASDVELVLDRITAADLTGVALAALSQPAE